MDDDQVPQPEILSALLPPNGTIFAVLDGSKLNQVGANLRHAGIMARPLFLDPGRPETVAAGPHLATIDSVSKIGELLKLCGIERASVFWVGFVTEPELFRHLRGINIVELADRSRLSGDPFGPSPDIVLFRHWDPSVLELVFPILEPGQRARIFGPMARFAFYSTESGRLRIAQAQDDWPPPPRGRLRISSSQQDLIKELMVARSHRAIASYLRETAPDHTAGMSEEDLIQFVVSSDKCGRSWGLRTEAGLGRFAWLTLATGGRLPDMSGVRAYVAAPGGKPDRRMKSLMGALAAKNTSLGGDA